MSKKLYTLSVKIREEQAADGSMKKKYIPIGMMLEGERGPYIILDRTFNAAGVPNPDNRTGVIVSMFEEKGDNYGNRQDAESIPF